MPLRPSRQRSTAERHALIERDIVTHLGGFADHHPHAMVDEYPPSDACPGVNFNAGEHTAKMRNEPAGKQPTPLAWPMRGATTQARGKHHVARLDVRPPP